VLITAGAIGLAAEAVGVATGVPFGRYAYAGTLGPQVLGVPVLVPLAWTMMAYPALLLGRRLAGSGTARTARVAVLGGATLAAWDLFLDPQMVAAGHWTWAHPRPSLPGVPAVPLTNAAGWLLVGTLLVAALDRVLAAHPPSHPPDVAREGLPAALLLWTWLGSTLANLAFFHRPWVALYGGIGLGLLVAPYLRSLAVDVRAARAAGHRRARPVTA
jgi:putative membrane protein